MPNTDPYGGSFTIPKQLHVDEPSFTADLLTIYASTTDLAAECPLCGGPSHRIHGYYTRTLAHLPWCGTPVRLRVRVHKFFCDEPSCERRIFAERLDEVSRVHARATDRQRACGPSCGTTRYTRTVRGAFRLETTRTPTSSETSSTRTT